MHKEEQRPNVILIICDQFRMDAISYNQLEHFSSTPNLDMMASRGYNFENAYSPVPTCVPARAALMTGMDQEYNGRVGYEDGVPWEYEKTMARTFTDMGYQTESIGKTHFYPLRNRLGYEHIVLSNGYLHQHRKYNRAYNTQFEYADDYLSFLREHLGPTADTIDNGANCNSWEVRPWTLPERLHPTNWLVSESIKFLERRDTTVPFFLTMSFEKPHAPLVPPQYYFDMYMDRLPEDIDLHLGNWQLDYAEVPSTVARKGKLKKDDQRRMVAAYLGLVSHIDNQLGRFLTALEEFPFYDNTIILFTSDHGDQLGEHHLMRKGYPYQGSIHIPFIIYDPGNLIQGKQKDLDQLVKIQDVFPTLVDLVGGGDVDVDGKSVKPLIFDQPDGWRHYIHGEHDLQEDSNQFILTEKWKLVWYSVRDEYQLFDMENDPHEEMNLIADEKYEAVIKDLKAKLVECLTGREEGFVKDGKLVPVPQEKIVATLEHPFKKEEA